MLAILLQIIVETVGTPVLFTAGDAGRTVLLALWVRAWGQSNLYTFQ